MKILLTVVLIIVGLALLTYGYSFSRHQVYDKPVADAAAKATLLSEPQLMSEMCYDAIILDNQGNLLTRPREKACAT